MAHMRKLMVSVWGKFDNKTALFKAMKTAGSLVSDSWVAVMELVLSDHKMGK